MIQTEWNNPHNGAMDYEEYARDAIGILRQNGSDTHAEAISRLLVRVVAIEAALAEAREDSKRLDWLHENMAHVTEWEAGKFVVQSRRTGNWFDGPADSTPRAAIDAARR